MSIAITTFRPQYREDFIRLNQEWIQTFFRLEASDLHTFAHIDDYILDRGGQIFLAVEGGDGREQGERVVGCCALIPHPESDSYELAKMAVEPQAQGHHVGWQLGQALISHARTLGARRIFLEGNTQLAASIHLYRKLGFREIPLEGQAYDRCDILMELLLDPPH